MIGLAALAFASCAKHDFETMTQEQIVKAEYDAKFVAHFQQPASNHTWGFGSASTRAFTRALSDMTAGANKNRNQWAATDGSFKLMVPTPLSEGQKLRVKAYFQTHRFLTWETPDMTNYFVQQVYTGSTNTVGSLSTEIYTSANGASVPSGENMNKLTVTADNVHVSDFNAANNVNTATDVKNNGTKLNDTQYHSDEITLMIGTQPTCVGYLEAESSVQHNDCCALVSAKDIDDWAATLETPIGENVWYGYDEDGYENKFWNRSFVGLDYEQQDIESLFIEKTIWNYDTNENETRGTVKRKDFMSKNMNWILFKGKMVAASTVSNDQLFFDNGEPVKWVDDQTNMFLGANLGTTQNTFNKQGTQAWFKDTYNVDITNSNEDYYDLDAVLECVSQGAYPKNNNMEFIKNLGGRDYVFSDWIVSLAPAQEIEDEEEEEFPDSFTGRIMAEDLTAGVDVTGRKSDWDFNDVVFDWAIKDGKAYVELLAAGGELQIKIGGKLVDGEVVGGVEIHSAQGLGAYMCNTGLKTVPTKKLILNAPDGETYTNGNDILLTVLKNGVWMEIPARRGQPTAKFNCLTTTKWCDEYVDIKKAYTKFNDWVGSESVNWQESEDTIGDLVDGKLENNAAALE